jgi:5-methylcytosine-specific restriction endonuclease McrA
MRICIKCDQEFKGNHQSCSACRTAALPPEKRSAIQRRNNNARRARKQAAQITGPISRDVYTAIILSGPCVYCGGVATQVDHVRPLTRGGWEHESNLVPACRPCNYSKRNRLLTEWRHQDRVARAVLCSPVVAAEWARLAEAGAG